MAVKLIVTDGNGDDDDNDKKPNKNIKSTRISTCKINR